MAESAKTAAIFDVDRTLVVPTSMERLFLPFLIRRRWVTPGDLARYLGYAARNWNRPGSEALNNKLHLKDKDPEELARLAAECFHMKIRGRVSPVGRRAVLDHRRQGHVVVLLTGSLEPLAQELKRELDADLVLASRLDVQSGCLSGRLAGQRPYGPEKARLLRQLADQQGLDLRSSFAYGDHHSDVEVLATVGNPRAVNPDRRLAGEARRRGWPVLHF